MSPTPELVLVPIERDGTPAELQIVLPDVAHGVLIALKELYDRNGFVTPWIGYLAREGHIFVGTCSFKSPPENNRVEIAYFTFPGNELRGVATAMARKLVGLAFHENPELIVAAQTLPTESASTRILKKLGFTLAGTVDHPEDGQVWEWQKTSR